MADHDDLFEVSALLQQQAEAFERLAERGRQIHAHRDAEGNEWVARGDFDAYVDSLAKHIQSSRALFSLLTEDQAQIIKLVGNLSRVVALLAQASDLPANMSEVPTFAHDISNTAFDHSERLSARAAQLGPIPSSGE